MSEVITWTIVAVLFTVLYMAVNRKHRFRTSLYGSLAFVGWSMAVITAFWAVTAK